MNATHHEDTNTTKATKLSLDARTEAVAADVVDSLLKVYRALGPGLLKSAYEVSLSPVAETPGLLDEFQRPQLQDGHEEDGVVSYLLRGFCGLRAFVVIS